MKVLGVTIANATMDEAVVRTREWCGRKDRTRVIYFANTHTLNLSAVVPGYRDVLNRADIVYGDGTGVRWAARRAGVQMRDNVNGTDFAPRLLGSSSGRLYLLGATPESNAAVADRCRRDFPGWEIVGAQHGYYDRAEEDRVVEDIRRAQPDLLFVAFGNPEQERFIDRHRHHLGARVAVGVGGLFDYLGGTNRRAPPAMRRAGLEWLYVMLTQPKKLVRYLFGNPLFIARVLSERFGVAQPARP